MGLQARIDTKTTTYAYDAGNNRVYKGESNSYQDNQTNGSSPELLTEYVYGSGVIENGHAYNSNQLIYYGKSGGPYRSFTYDANGNRRTATFNGNTDTYSWDFENRLLTLDLETGSAAANGEYAYAYDYRSRRISRAENNASGATLTVLSFSGGTSVLEMNQDGSGDLSVQSEMIRGSDWGGGVGGLLYSLRSGQFAAKSYNSRGDVVSQTDSSGAVTWQAAYEAFGTRSQETDPADNPDRQRANTKEEDPTGLLNEGFRYRDLEAGVFLTRDPAGFVDGPNVYTYVRQNPWTKFDPLGLESDKDGVKINRDGHHISPVKTWRDNDSLSPEVRQRLDSYRIKPSVDFDAPKHGNSEAHAKYAEKVSILQKEYIDSALDRGVNPGGLSGKEARDFAEEMIDHVMKDEYVSKFNSIVAQGEGSAPNLNKMLRLYEQTGGKPGWSKGYETASNWIGKGSRKLPLIGAVVTTAGVAVGIANAESAQQFNEAIANGVIDSIPIGNLVVDASGLRDVSKLQDVGKKFRDDPDFYFQKTGENDWSGKRADDIMEGMNNRKEIMNSQ